MSADYLYSHQQMTMWLCRAAACVMGVGGGIARRGVQVTAPQQRRDQQRS